ncbi:MAG: N-acetyltransferase [Phycisphaerae bacterium]|nr:MAG: N-acetyltransferase [Phycisphaerae bacterium]
MNASIRDASPHDTPFLKAMLYEAAYWRPGQPRPPIDTALADPELAKLLANWGNNGDVGVIAVSEDAEPIGAAWYRFWTDDHHSYGYVDAATPEIAIGVVHEWRGYGVGRALLEALIERARSANVGTLSLSVERDNPALRLYERMGFVTVGSLDNAWTMTLTLND